MFSFKTIVMPLIWLLLAYSHNSFAVINLSHTRITDVTPSGFSVIWYADQPSQPSIQIFEDQAGTINVTSSYEVSEYPMQGLDANIATNYEYLQSRHAFVTAMKAQGLMQLQVQGLSPGQAYYFKVISENQADAGVWPSSGTVEVMTQVDNSWVIDARQLLIDFNFIDDAGWPVMVSTAGAAYPVSALIGDAAATGQAVVNIANLFGFDGLNWASSTTASLLIEVIKGNGEIVSSNVDVDLSAVFNVASNQLVNFELPFNGSLHMLSPALKVYTQGASVQLSWTDEAPTVSCVISLYVDTDNQNEDGSLIITSINEDDDGTQDTYAWDVTTISDGRYYVYTTLSDGSSTISSYAPGRITVDIVGLDGDNDGMSDLWEQHYFETLARDGTADFDNDTRSDAQEYQDGTDPTVITGITTPIIESPLPGTETDLLRPDLIVTNGAHAPGTVATYTCEVYADQSLSVLVEKVEGLAEGVDSTTCLLVNDLADNALYYWRARATVMSINSQWVNGTFFVNTANDLPAAFNTSSPNDGAVIATLQPVLEVMNSIDVDGDVLTYQFKLYTDPEVTNLISTSPIIAQGVIDKTTWTLASNLAEDEIYYWFAVATDEHGAQTQSNVASFKVNTIISTPGLPAIASPLNGAEVEVSDVTLTVTNAVDQDGLGLDYLFELDTVNSFDSTELLASGLIPESAVSTSWLVPQSLLENTNYYWRAMATNGTNNSGLVTASFFFNTVNDAPSVPVVNNPDNQTWVETQTPTLSVNPSLDLDNDSLTYEFELYSDAQMTNLIEQSVTANDFRTVATPLTDNSWFYWRARAIDEHALESGWTSLMSFFVNNSGFDDSPSITLIAPATDIPDASLAPITIAWTDDDPDSNAIISLYYDTDTSGTDGTLIVSGIEEDQDGTNDSYVWDATSLQPGSYYIYAVISDALSSSTVYLSTRITVVGALDSDADGVADSVDNCTLVANPDQRDTDGDHYGNNCDPDFDNNGIVNASDLAFLKSKVFTADPDADLNGDGVVNAADLAIIKFMFFKPPGPAAIVVAQDSDADGLADSIDNCTLVANPAQRDSDGDQYGNICDPDIDNNGIVNALDLALFKSKFFTADPDADFNGDGIVNASDLVIIKTMFFKSPGPSGLVP